MLEQSKVAAWFDPISLRQTRGGSTPGVDQTFHAGDRCIGDPQ